MRQNVNKRPSAWHCGIVHWTFLIYATEADVRVDLQVDNGTFWASQA
jgi:hypothetical protein